jgi:methylation protein EvaC
MSICKITNSKTKNIINFGKMPISNLFLKEKDFKSEFFYNLEASFSEKISLFQINDHPKPKMMFNENYPFFTSSSNYMKKHFCNYANWAKKKYLNSNSKIIEIGSNDGTFLQNFTKTEIDHLGFEPSRNVSNVAKKKKN